MSTLRSILHREAGHALGPIRRMIAPLTSGERLKPFVFLDFFNAEVEPGFGFGWHPHSGIATLTWQPDTEVDYEDTTGQRGVLAPGGLEWMNAGGGAWHRGHLLSRGHATGFQLWVAMPPGVEDGPAFGQYILPADVPKLRIPGGELQILLGEVTSADARATSPIESHQSMNYIVLTLERGARWTFSPPAAHEIAWAMVFDGEALVQGQAAGHELLTLDTHGDIEIQASSPKARILIGTAAPHPYPLVTGHSSVHTRRASLLSAQARIRATAPWERIKQRDRSFTS